MPPGPGIARRSRVAAVRTWPVWGLAPGLRYHGRVTSEGRSPRHAQHQLELGLHVDQPRQQEGVLAMRNTGWN